MSKCQFVCLFLSQDHPQCKSTLIVNRQRLVTDQRSAHFTHAQYISCFAPHVRYIFSTLLLLKAVSPCPPALPPHGIGLVPLANPGNFFFFISTVLRTHCDRSQLGVNLWWCCYSGPLTCLLAWFFFACVAHNWLLTSYFSVLSNKLSNFSISLQVYSFDFIAFE